MCVKVKNESGMVLVMVTMIVIVMSLLVVGLLTRSTSRALTVERQIRTLESEQASKSGFWQAKDACGAGNPLPASYNLFIQNRAYTVTYTGDCGEFNVAVTY